MSQSSSRLGRRSDCDADGNDCNSRFSSADLITLTIAGSCAAIIFGMVLFFLLRWIARKQFARIKGRPNVNVEMQPLQHTFSRESFNASPDMENGRVHRQNKRFPIKINNPFSKKANPPPKSEPAPNYLYQLQAGSSGAWLASRIEHDLQTSIQRQAEPLPASLSSTLINSNLEDSARHTPVTPSTARSSQSSLPNVDLADGTAGRADSGNGQNKVPSLLNVPK
jgi:hypothetical protein